MSNPVCSLWWLLAALLTGWLLCGWFARQYLPRVTGGSAEQDREIERLRAELAAMRSPAPSEATVARAVAVGLGDADDLTLIEGVGPKIAAVFNDAGIGRFAQVALMTPADIQPLLDAAGPNFRIADPQTWPEQAALAAAGRWDELKLLQDSLTGGRKL